MSEQQTDQSASGTKGNDVIARPETSPAKPPKPAQPPALARAASATDAEKARAKSVATRGPLLLGWLGMLLLVGGFGSWAVLGQIAGAIIASGQIAVESNRQVVQHPDGGVVAQVLTREGEIAKAGDILLRLDDTLLQSNAQILRGQLNEIRARSARLQAERDGAPEISFPAALLAAAAADPKVAEVMDGQERLFAARADTMARETDQLTRRKEQIASQVDGITAQQGALDIQLSLIQEELADQQTLLDRGLAQASRVLALRREEARLRGQVGEFAAGAAELSGRATEIEIEILKLGTRLRESSITELRDLQFREAELAEELRALEERLARMDIRAPVSGIVYDLAVFGERAVIRPADPVLYLVPQDRPLVIQAQVSPIHVDQVYPGQPTTLRFSAFDARTTPEVFGTVRRVSADAFTDRNTGMTFYRAEITLNEGETARLGDNVMLPGMPVEAYIRTDDRAPIRYLLKPLLDYFNRAFREN